MPDDSGRTKGHGSSLPQNGGSSTAVTQAGVSGRAGDSTGNSSNAVDIDAALADTRYTARSGNQRVTYAQATADDRVASGSSGGGQQTAPSNELDIDDVSFAAFDRVFVVEGFPCLDVHPATVAVLIHT